MEGLPPKLRLQEQFRSAMRLHHYSFRTEKLLFLVHYFTRLLEKRHLLELEPSDVSAFLGGWLRIAKLRLQLRISRCMPLCFCMRGFLSRLSVR